MEKRAFKIQKMALNFYELDPMVISLFSIPFKIPMKIVQFNNSTPILQKEQ